MAFRERFQRAAAYAKVEWKPTAIGASLGLAKQTVARWMDKGEPSREMVYLIAEKWKVDARWLATNEGAMVPRVVMEPGAAYQAFTEASLEIARAFDQLSPACQDHVRRQIELLLGVPADHSGRQRAAQHDVEIKGGLFRERSGKRKKTVR